MIIIDDDGIIHKVIPIATWNELKETITELRDSNGHGKQQDVAQFLLNYMDILEKQIKGRVNE